MVKLLQDVRLQIARVTTRDMWDIEELMQVINSEVEAREMTERIKINETRKLDKIFQGRVPCPQLLFLLKMEALMNEDAFIVRLTIIPLVVQRLVSQQGVKKYLRKKVDASSAFQLGIVPVIVVHTDVVEGKRYHQSLCETASIRPDKSTEVSPDNSGQNVIVRVSPVFFYRPLVLMLTQLRTNWYQFRYS